MTRPGLNFFKKSLLNDQVYLKKMDRTVLFQSWHGQFLVSIKQPGLNIGKSLYQTTSTILFSNSRSLEQPSLIIETLEYSN